MRLVHSPQKPEATLELLNGLNGDSVGSLLHSCCKSACVLFHVLQVSLKCLDRTTMRLDLRAWLVASEVKVGSLLGMHAETAGGVMQGSQWGHAGQQGGQVG